MQESEPRLERPPDFPKGDMLIRPVAAWSLGHAAWIMASATPVASEAGTSISARAARGGRGLHPETASPHGADAGIEAGHACEAIAFQR